MTRRRPLAPRYRSARFLPHRTWVVGLGPPAARVDEAQTSSGDSSSLNVLFVEGEESTEESAGQDRDREEL